MILLWKIKSQQSTGGKANHKTGKETVGEFNYESSCCQSWLVLALFRWKRKEIASAKFESFALFRIC